MKHYILTFRTHVTLRGPFDTADEAAKFGRQWQADNSDCPLWHTVELMVEGGILLLYAERANGTQVASEAFCKALAQVFGDFVPADES